MFYCIAVLKFQAVDGNGKTSHRIMKSDPFGDATKLVSDIQVGSILYWLLITDIQDTKEGNIVANTIILNKTADSLSTS